MDRSKWEYKKLGEVCTPKSCILRANKLFGDDDIIDYVDISSIDNTTHSITQPTNYVFKEAPSRAQQKVERGDILYSLVRPNLKNIAVVTSPDTEKYVASSGFCVLRGKDVETQYLYHMVLGNSFTNYILGLVSGANYPAVREDDVKAFSFRCPPIADQQRIVAELDCLNEMIALKQEQLKEFDKLAQSIFYDMFGDPVVNDKGWDICRFGDCCQNLDSQRRPITAKDRIPGDIPYYGASGIVDYVEGYLFDDDYLLISEDGANLVMRNTPIAFRISGKTWVNNHAHVLKFEHLYEQVYFEFTINLRDISEYITGCAQPKLTQANLNRLPIPLPPLALQQQFAEKIQAIEAQKELVKKSIAETQHLLDSRMDFYFN